MARRSGRRDFPSLSPSCPPPARYPPSPPLCPAPTPRNGRSGWRHHPDPRSVPSRRLRCAAAAHPHTPRSHSGWLPHAARTTPPALYVYRSLHAPRHPERARAHAQATRSAGGGGIRGFSLAPRLVLASQCSPAQVRYPPIHSTPQTHAHTHTHVHTRERTHLDKHVEAPRPAR